MATASQTYHLNLAEAESFFSDPSHDLCDLYHCLEEDTDKGYLILDIDSRYVAVQKRILSDIEEVSFHVSETLGDAQALLEYGGPDADLVMRIRACCDSAGTPRWTLEEDGGSSTHSSHSIATQLAQRASDAERPPQD